MNKELQRRKVSPAPNGKRSQMSVGFERKGIQGSFAGTVKMEAGFQWMWRR